MGELPPKINISRVSSIGEWLRSHFNDEQRYLIIWIVTGVACGLAAVMFHEAIDFVFNNVRYFARAWGGDGWGYYLFLGLAPAVGGLLTGIILDKYTPNAAGSGIPQTKVCYYRDFGYFKFRDAVARFFLGSISVGFGMSLGREGPTVHICAAIASKVGQIAGIAKKRVQEMVPLGMGAGIAAAFNAPMAAVFFVFEELLGGFSSKSFFGIFLTVVIASTVNRLILGEHPAFDIELGVIATDWWMFLAIPLGLISALVGKAFVEGLLRLRMFFREQKRIPGWLRPAAGGLMVGIIAITVALITDGHLGIFGIGYKDADEVLNGRMVVLLVVVLLFVGKFLATIFAYSSGGSGGLFAPTLFMGAMLGGIIGIMGQPLFGYENEIIGAMALLGMGTMFAAIIRCPMTSVIIIWEMTGEYGLILPLMAGNMLAWLLNSRIVTVPLYDALLLQDKISLRRLPQYMGDQDWKNLPVSTIMSFDVVSVQANSRLRETLELLKGDRMKHHAYPVKDDKDQLVGIITHHEMEESLREGNNCRVREILSPRKLISVYPEDSIRKVAQILVIEDVMQVPVVSKKDHSRMVGFVTLHDVARQQNAIDQTIDR